MFAATAFVPFLIRSRRSAKWSRYFRIEAMRMFAGSLSDPSTFPEV